MMKSLLLFSCLAILGVIPLGCDDTGKIPHDVHIAEADLSNPKVGSATSGNIVVTFEFRDYHGKEVGFWGSETFPPFNVLRSLTIRRGGRVIVVDERWLKDLANVPSNAISGIAFQGEEYRFVITGGDGGWAYACYMNVDPKTGEVSRTVDNYGD